MFSRSGASVRRFRCPAVITDLIAAIVCLLPAMRAGAADLNQTDGKAAWDGPGEQLTTLFPIVKDRKLGFIDQRGRVVLEPSFALSHVGATRIWPPTNASVLADNPTAEEYDRPGAYPVRFPSFHDGVAMVVKDDRIGYVRRDGKILASPMFRAGADFHDRVAWAQLEDMTYCLLDTNGRTLIKGVEKCSLFEEGLAPIKIGGRFGYIDHTGTMIIKARYDSASAFSEGVACVEETGQQWLIDRRGRRIAPIDGRLEKFSEGLAAVFDRTTKTFGYIDRHGKQAITAQFETAEPFREGLAAVRLRGKFGFINREGRFSIEPRFERAFSFVKGRARVRVLTPDDQGQLREAIVDRRGEYVVEPVYESIGSSCDGFAIVKTTKGRFGLIDLPVA